MFAVAWYGLHPMDDLDRRGGGDLCKPSHSYGRCVIPFVVLLEAPWLLRTTCGGHLGLQQKEQGKEAGFFNLWQNPSLCGYLDISLSFK